MHFLQTLFDPELLIKTLGLVGIFGAVFAESGFFFGVIFPGDSLLFAAGLLSSQGYLPIVPLLLGSLVCAITGDQIGYWTGRKLGPKLFTREESFIFKKSYLERARIYFDAHGPKTIILARFIPYVRTFAPMLAGVGEMKYKTFVKYNVVGGCIWVFGMTLLGYFLGRVVPNMEHYILPAVGAVFVISFIPLIWKIAKELLKKK